MYAVIIAGGRGTRFWPASRKDNPKQLLNIVGKETMLQTIDKRVRSQRNHCSLFSYIARAAAAYVRPS